MIHNGGKHDVFTTFLIIFSSVILTISFFKEPQITGDGHEYYLITKSFYNHFSPDLQKQDIEDAKKIRISFKMYDSLYDQNITSTGGYFLSNYGDWYSYHFFAYSLLASPLTFILNIFGENDLKSFQILNTILFIMMIWIIYNQISITDSRKKMLIIFLLFNPVIFYLNWTHPEVYTYFFVVLSLLYFEKEKYVISFIFMAVASWQNPPVILFSFLVLLKNLNTYFKQYKWKQITLEVFSLSLSLLPIIFYFYNFGLFNLISSKGYASFKVISFEKAFDLFFGLTHGMILFYPFIILIFFYLIIKNIFLKNTKNYIYILSIVMMVALMTTTTNWNSGMSYALRYSIWLYPFIIFFILQNYSSIF